MKNLSFPGFYLVLAFLLLLFLNTQTTFAKDAPLWVMTFNIRYNEPRDGINAWTNRKTKVADVIRFHQTDLVGVQEAQFNQLQDLENLLPDFAWCGVGREGENKGEYSAILYRKSRFKLLETHTFWLSENPDKVGGKGWDADYPRIVTWAKFKDNQTKKIFYQFNTHFDHIGAKARFESSKLLLKQIPKIAGKSLFVVTGDFNAQEDTNVYRILTGKEEAGNFKLIDARYISQNGHFGGNSSFNAFKELEPNRKIDYIFVGETTKVLEHGILSDRWDGLWASDHLPVLAEIIF
ncbi:MAG: endonuclease/exonuclease/phosphatase family protein [Pyrinomonadaceae bacterium]|nr:endonuclease/exonuclease/phosphatase family protein [Pyrinomonadaceae bacterium]